MALMPTLYTSGRLPTGFTAQDPQSIGNGTLARGALFSTIADNQVFLASGDTPICNFWGRFVADTGGVDAERRAAGSGAWTNSTYTITVEVPPFCTHAEFYFFAFKDFNGTSATQSYIKISVSGGDSRIITHIPIGEDAADLGKSYIGDSFFGKWVRASGISQYSNLASDPGALKLVTAATNTWRRVDVDVQVTAYCYVLSAAYHVMPPRETFTITY